VRIFLSRQFLNFLFVGGIAAVINFFSRILYNQLVGFPSAVALAYLTGMTTAFVLARVFVFQNSSHSTFRSAVFFSIVNFFSFAQTWIVSMLLVYRVFPEMGVVAHSKEIATFIGIVVPVFGSFIAHKYISFKN
jgi:putative flippase GtrA